MEPITTRVAYCGVEEYRFFGQSVFSDLVGRESFLGASALASLNRRLSPEESDLLDVMSLILTAADPRIWPLKIARLAASFGSAEAGLAAANLCLIGSKMGPDTVHRAAAFLAEVRRSASDEAPSDESLFRAALSVMKKVPIIPGFGVPGRPFDQRLRVLDEYIARANRRALPFYRVKDAVIRAAGEMRVKAPPNISIGIAAACLDMGFEPKHLGPLAHLLAMNASFANAVEGAQQSSDVLKCLPDEAVQYVGPSPRTSPRKLRSQTSD